MSPIHAVCTPPVISVPGMYLEPDQTEYAEFSTLLIHCKSHYIHDGDYSALCYSGVWHPDPSLTTCHAPCPIPAIDSDVQHFDKATKVSESERYLHDTVIRYKCVQNKGVFEGTKTAKCTDGNWDPPEVPICRDKCFAPADVLPVKPLAYKHGSTVVFACVAGTVSNGINSATCNDGTWSADIICSIPPDTTETHHALTTEKQITTIRTTFGVPDCVYPDLGTQSAYLEPYQPHGYKNSKVVYFYCNETIPYVSQASICFIGGVWLPPLPAKICKDPCPVPATNGMTYDQLSGHTDGVIFTHGSRLSVSCETGDPGPTTSTCNDGVWEPLISCPDPVTTSPYSTSTIPTEQSTISESVSSATSYEPSSVHTEIITESQLSTSDPTVVYTSNIMSTGDITQLISTDSEMSTMESEGTTVYTPSRDMMTSLQTEYQTETNKETTIPSLKTTSVPSTGLTRLLEFTELGTQTDILTDTLVTSPGYPTSERTPETSVPSSSTQEIPVGSTSDITVITETPMYTDYITELVTDKMYSSTQVTTPKSSSKSLTTHLMTEGKTEKVTTESLLTEILTSVFKTPAKEPGTPVLTSDSGATDFTSLLQFTELGTQTVTERLTTAPTTLGFSTVDTESPFRTTRTQGTDFTSRMTELGTQITEMTEVFTTDTFSTSDRHPKSSNAPTIEDTQTEACEMCTHKTAPFKQTTHSEITDFTSLPQFTELGTETIEMTKAYTTSIVLTSNQTPESILTSSTENILTEENVSSLRTTNSEGTTSTSPSKFTELRTPLSEMTEELTTVIFFTSQQMPGSSLSVRTEDIFTENAKTTLRTTRPEVTDSTKLPQFTERGTQTDEFTEEFTTAIFSKSESTPGSTVSPTTQDIITEETETVIPTTHPKATDSTSLSQFTEFETVQFTTVLFTDIISRSQRTPASSEQSVTGDIPTRETSDYTQKSELTQSSPGNLQTSVKQEQTELATSIELSTDILITSIPSSMSEEQSNSTTDTTSLFAYTDQRTDVSSDSNTDSFPSTAKREPTTSEGDSTVTNFATEFNEVTPSVQPSTGLLSSVLTKDIPSTVNTMFRRSSTPSAYVTITDIFETGTRPSITVDAATVDSTTEGGTTKADDNINTTEEVIVTSKETESLTKNVTETSSYPLRTTHSQSTDVTNLPLITKIETQTVAVTEALTTAGIYSNSKQTPGNSVLITDGTSTSDSSSANSITEVIDYTYEYDATKVTTEVAKENTDNSQSSTEQKPTTLETAVITTNSVKMSTIGTEVITDTFTDMVFDTKPYPSETNSPPTASNFYSTLPALESSMGSKFSTSTENTIKYISTSYMTSKSNTNPSLFTDILTQTNDRFATNIFTKEITKESQPSDFTVGQTSSTLFKSQSSAGPVSYASTVPVSTHPTARHFSTTDTTFSTDLPQTVVTDINTERETVVLTDTVPATDITKLISETTSATPISTSTEGSTERSITEYSQITTSEDSSTASGTTKQGVSNTGIFTDIETLTTKRLSTSDSTSGMKDVSTHSPTSSENTRGPSSASTGYVPNVSEDSFDKTTAAETYVTTFRGTTSFLPSTSYSQTAESTWVNTKRSTFESTTPEKEVTSGTNGVLTTTALKTAYATDVTEDTTDVSIDITDWSSTRATVSPGTLSTQPMPHTKISEITRSLVQTTVAPTTSLDYGTVSTMEDSTSQDSTAISELTTSQSSFSFAADSTTTSPTGSVKIITDSTTTRHNKDKSTLYTKLLQTTAPSQSIDETLVIILGSLAGIAFILGMVGCCMCCLWMAILRSSRRRRRRDSALGDDLEPSSRRVGILQNPYFIGPATSNQTSITTLPISQLSTH